MPEITANPPGRWRLTIQLLAWTAITDAGLAHLAGLTRLETLGLCGTAVTDAGLVHLRGLKTLRALDVRTTKVREKGVAMLREEFPNLYLLSNVRPKGALGASTASVFRFLSGNGNRGGR